MSCKTAEIRHNTMAPFHPRTSSTRLAVSSLDSPHNPSSSSSTVACCRPSTSDLDHLDQLDLDLDLDLESEDVDSAILSPRTLYAQPSPAVGSTRSLPSGRFRKNMRDLTGFPTTEEEFDALPIAVRRKYFSTLERLRFAQASRSNALYELPIQQNSKKSSLADRRGVATPVINSSLKGISPRRLRKHNLSRTLSVSSDEASWFLTLPEKIKKKEFTREEQVVLAGRLRESVILDAADEAIYKASRRASRNLTPLFDPPSPYTPSMGPHSPEISADPSIADAFYESFRWIDEEKDLDLRLDNYHANLDGVVIPTTNSFRKPSFRRQMSVSKMPFGRDSMSSLQPLSPKLESYQNRHQKSKTISVIAPRHTVSDLISPIDPNAKHYQDPEARLKLRVYLASPQKFDEAIEFGFPSMDGVPDDKENKPPRSSRCVAGGSKSQSLDKTGLSFLLNDIDTASLFEDDASMIDPDSPLTPIDKDMGFRTALRAGPAFKGSKTSSDFAHLGITKPVIVKRPESYTQAMAGNREMTLRMTLTRPDLRADESGIYGWQSSNVKSPRLEEPLAEHEIVATDMKGPFGGLDGWGPVEKDNSAVKRFWNKVRSQKK